MMGFLSFRLRPHLWKMEPTYCQKKQNKLKKNVCVNNKIKKKWIFFSEQEAVLIGCNLDLACWTWLRTFWNIGSSVLSRVRLCKKHFFAIKRNTLKALQNAYQILSQSSKTFPMSYQRPLYVLFYPCPGAYRKFHYLSAPWVEPKTFAGLLKYYLYIVAYRIWGGSVNNYGIHKLYRLHADRQTTDTTVFLLQFLSPRCPKGVKKSLSTIKKKLETVAIYILQISGHRITFVLFSGISYVSFWVVSNIEKYLNFSKLSQKSWLLSELLFNLSKYLIISVFIWLSDLVTDPEHICLNILQVHVIRVSS